MKEKLAMLLISLLIMKIWQIGYKYCIFLLIPIFWNFLLFRISYAFSVNKRNCMADCYFNKNNFLYKIIKRKFFLAILSFLGSLILTIIFSLNIINFNTQDYIILVILSLFNIILYEKFIQSTIINPTIKSIVTKNFISHITAFIFMIIFLFVNLNQTPPNYLDNELITTLHNAYLQNYSACSAINYIIQISNQIVAIKWWILYKFTFSTNFAFLKEIVWIIYLTGNYLMLLAFSRYILEMTTYFPFKGKINAK